MSDSTALAGRFEIMPLRRVIYGPNCVREQIGQELAAVGARRALIVTGQTLATKTDLVDNLRAWLGDRCAGVFAETRQHVPRESVLALAERARSVGADALISFGGGSPIDAAKMAALCLAEDVHTAEDLDRFRVRFHYPDQVEIPPLTQPALPHFTISTTLSAGEFTNIAGCTDLVRRAKDLYRGDSIMPVVSFLDSALTVATPAQLWASTGVRALDHAIESVYSKKAMPFSDALALKAIEILFAHLARSSRDPADLAGRGQCQLAAWMSIFALPNVSVGLSHGLGHQLGARRDVPHGVTSCILLPPVMDFNRPVTVAQQARIAVAMGSDPTGRAESALAAEAAEALRGLIRELGIPARLRDWGVERSDLAPIAGEALEDLVVLTNPRPIESAEQVVALLESVY